jgi:hypothetical protein
MKTKTFHRINCSLSVGQRLEWNQWKTDLYLATDRIRDGASLPLNCEESKARIRQKIDQLMEQITAIPTFVK